MKLSKIKKMKMPEKKGEDMAGMDMGPEDMSDTAEESSESPELAASEKESGMEEMPQEAPSDLASLSDDELMAEIKKRGLMAQMAESAGMPEEMA